MVHPITARSTRRAAVLARQSGSVGDVLSMEPSISQRYLLVPDPLIVAYAHDPLAIGVYVAIARLAVAAKSNVPIAARDLVSGWEAIVMPTGLPSCVGSSSWRMVAG